MARCRTVISRCIFSCLPLGRIEEALQQLRVTERADPRSYEVHFDAIYVLVAANRYNEASGHCEKLPVDAPDKTWCLHRLRLEQGGINEATRMLETAYRNNASGRVRNHLAYTYALAGHREDAEKLAGNCARPD